jgi:hypothetical protein
MHQPIAIANALEQPTIGATVRETSDWYNKNPLPTPNSMSQTTSFQTVIEYVEALSTDEQDLLFDLIHKRRITSRRQEIAQNAVATLEAVKNGTATRGTAAEIMADIFGDDE